MTSLNWLDILTEAAGASTLEACGQKLLSLLRHCLHYDAAALLRRESSGLLRPIAVVGLSEDTLGRRFNVDDHPRLRAILHIGTPIRFAADSGLPDPYDGLVENHAGDLDVHDCMGVVIGEPKAPWGLLTVDAMEAGQFSPPDQTSLAQFATIAWSLIRSLEAGAAALRTESAAVITLEQVPQDMIGSSPAMKRLAADIATVAETELAVLIQGETGTGKELVAQAIHKGSKRVAQPLVQVNCAALPETLAESELFGHIRGAFTGATSDRLGKFELADGGTLFLDEIGELPLVVQAKLLRVLQTGEIQRVGSDASHRVDVRVVAATNRDLAKMVRDNRYRADLYHRLSVYPIRVPPLSERAGDVLRLAGYFLERNRATLGLRNLRLSEEARQCLRAYNWPGNVRELEHVISRAAIKVRAARPQDDLLTIEAANLDLDTTVRPSRRPDVAMTMGTPETQEKAPTLRDAVDRFQRECIERSLARHEDNWSAVARELSVDRGNLHRLARRLGIK